MDPNLSSLTIKYQIYNVIIHDHYNKSLNNRILLSKFVGNAFIVLLVVSKA